jgi:hypothetical protein
MLIFSSISGINKLFQETASHFSESEVVLAHLHQQDWSLLNPSFLLPLIRVIDLSPGLM